MRNLIFAAIFPFCCILNLKSEKSKLYILCIYLYVFLILLFFAICFFFFKLEEYYALKLLLYITEYSLDIMNINRIGKSVISA